MLAATVLLAACTTTVDGREVGERICGAADPMREDRHCDAIDDYARTLLDDEQPGHAAIRDVEIYFDPVRHLAFGQRAYVLVRLDDGTHQLYRVHCGFNPQSDNCFTVEPEPSP